MLEYILIGTVGISAFAIWNSMSTYNRLMALDERCTTAFSDVDALLKYRHDLIPGLLDNVRGIVGQENHVVDMVMQAYAEATQPNNLMMRFKAEKNLGRTVNNLFSSMDRMPQTNVASHFVDLRNTFKEVENRIVASRRFYNSTVEEHNATLRQFPANIIGAKFRIDTRRQFTLGAERVFKDEAVSMKF